MQPKSRFPINVPVFLTGSDKHDSPVVPVQSELSVPVDKQPVQVDTLRAAKSDALLFAVVVDTSKSDAGSAAMIKKQPGSSSKVWLLTAIRATSFYLTFLLRPADSLFKSRRRKACWMPRSSVVGQRYMTQSRKLASRS